MKKQGLLVIILMLVVMLLLSLAAYAAPQRYSVRSNIGGTQYGATREVGHFTVRANGSASDFQGNSHVISSAQNQAIGYSFSIEKIGQGNQKTVTVFERSWNGQVDTPVSLAKLVLGPGYYALLVGGRPGSSAMITFTGVNVTIE